MSKLLPLTGPVEQPLNLSWYVIHTYSRHEPKVELSLSLKGLEVFLPRVMVRSRRRDRLQMLEVPLFPGYLFVHTELNDFDYSRIIRQDGVVRILGSGEKHTPVPEEIVKSIQTLVNSGQPLYQWTKLVPGRSVRVVNGPLAGAGGVILRLKRGKSRLVVGVELLGRSVCAELAEEYVEIGS